jgi:hypothetical protein
MIEDIEAETQAPPPEHAEVEDAEAETRAPPLEDAEAETRAPSAEEGEVEAGDAAEDPVADLLEQAGRAAGVLAVREAQLVAARHTTELRRAAQDVAVALGIAITLLTAFALANWAAVHALSGPLPGWRAPLVLAAAWIVIGILLLVFVLNRGDRVFGWRQWRMLGADQEQKIRAREEAREEAEQGLRESLERLAGAVGSQAGVLVAAAVVPVADGVIDAGEGIIEEIDAITDNLEEAVPGGSVINWVADVALIPGRYCVRVARFALKRSPEA